MLLWRKSDGHILYIWIKIVCLLQSVHLNFMFAVTFYVCSTVCLLNRELLEYHARVKIIIVDTVHHINSWDSTFSSSHYLPVMCYGILELVIVSVTAKTACSEILTSTDICALHSYTHSVSAIG